VPRREICSFGRNPKAGFRRICRYSVAGQVLQPRIEVFMALGSRLQLDSRKGLSLALTMVLVAGLTAIALAAQSTTPGQAPAAAAPAPQSLEAMEAAGVKMAFDVTSVKPNKSDDRVYTNFPIGPGDVYSPTGGLFSAKHLPLIAYIQFAYRMTGAQIQDLISTLPKWTLTDNFDIEARVQGNPTKDQMRLMMQALLADRFKLAMHSESQQKPVYALVLASRVNWVPIFRHIRQTNHARPRRPPPARRHLPRPRCHPHLARSCRPIPLAAESLDCRQAHLAGFGPAPETSALHCSSIR
jgi:hypothetical protein